MPTEAQLSAVAERMSEPSVTGRPISGTAAEYDLPTGRKPLSTAKPKQDEEEPKPRQATAEDAPKPAKKAAASDDESKARAAGWLPRDEFEADPDNADKSWRSAKDFNERGDHIKRTAQQKKRLDETDTALNTALALNKTLMDRLKKLEIGEKTKERDLAIELADKDKVKSLDKDIAEINKAFDLPAAKEQEPEVRAEVKDWAKENGWFKTKSNAGDEEATGVAIRYYNRLELQNPDDIANNLTKTTAYIKKRFPELFDDEDAAPEPTSRRSAVEQPGRTQARKSGKTFADLPEEAKPIARRMVERGTYATKDEYAAAYFQAFGA